MSFQVEVDQTLIEAGTRFDWARANQAARALVEQCAGARYLLAEPFESHLIYAARVCAALNTIIAVLNLKPVDDATTNNVRPTR